MFTLVSALAGCNPNRAYEDTVERAESGVAIYLELTAKEAAHLLSARASLSEVSEKDITYTFLHDLRGYTGATPGPPDKRAVYDIAEAPNGTVTFSVFFGSHANANSWLSTTSQSRHSCGTLTGRFTEKDLALEDADCPPAIEALAGEDSIAVSMTEIATKFDVAIGGAL